MKPSDINFKIDSKHGLEVYYCMFVNGYHSPQRRWDKWLCIACNKIYNSQEEYEKEHMFVCKIDNKRFEIEKILCDKIYEKNTRT